MAKYQKQQWYDLPNTTTPISSDRLNYMEEGIYQASMSGGGAYVGEEEPTEEGANLWVDPNVSSAKYKYENEWRGLLASGDTLPIGSIVDYDGDNVPSGYELAETNTIIASLGQNTRVSNGAKVPLTTVVTSTGSKLTLVDGGIKIGSGISHVEISAQISVQYSETTGNYGCVLKKNEKTLVKSPIYKASNGNMVSSNISSWIVDVNEGDMIYVFLDAPTAVSLRDYTNVVDNYSETYISVKEI